MTTGRTIWLASASPRRRQLLTEASIAFRVQPPDIDDGALRPRNVTPAQWVMAMAYLKGRRVTEMIKAADPGADGIVLSADTICALDGAILGQPADVEAARRMLLRLRDRGHHTLTGVALIDLVTVRRLVIYDRAEVRVGRRGR